jgi:hypothetical protein
VLFGWTIAGSMLLITCAISVANQEYSPLMAACFNALAPIVWCFYFAWFIFVAQAGHKSGSWMGIEGTFDRFSMISDLLIDLAEWKYFKIGSNLSFGIYLVQFAVFHYNIATTRSSAYYDHYNTLVS